MRRWRRAMPMASLVLRAPCRPARRPTASLKSSASPEAQFKNIGITEPAEHQLSLTRPGVTIPLDQPFPPAFAHAVSDAVLSGCSNFAEVRSALN